MTKEKYLEICNDIKLTPVNTNKIIFSEEDLIEAHKKKEEETGRLMVIISAKAPKAYQQWVKEHVRQRIVR